MHGPLRALSERCQPADSRPWYVRPLSLEFRILGPLEALEDGRPLRLGGVKQRSVLAILLLHAGDVVSTDRLIDLLWGEDPPADAQTALQQHVSRLRKQLEPHPVLVTRQPGYTLDLGDVELDLLRFEALRDEGLAQLADGRADEAARTLRSALALWRGAPLADLRDEEFAVAPARRLDELRLDALEARIDADLAGGRHRELVGELGQLVAEHPLREQLRGQLMLALYRSGRQAEALEQYGDARRIMVEELGIEPGPELQRLQRGILEQDPALDSSARPPLPARRRRLSVVAAGVAALAVTAGAALGMGLRGDGDPRAAVASGEPHVIAIDAASGSERRRIGVGRSPAAIAASDGYVWVVDGDARTLIRVAESSRVIETLSTGATPTDVTVGAGAVWVANGTPLETAQFIGPVGTSVVRLDPTTRTSRSEVALPFGDGSLSNLVENHLAVTSDAVWAVTPDFGVVRIEASTGAITARSKSIRAGAIAAGRAGVWVLGVDGTAALLDERTGQVVARTTVPARTSAIAVGDDAAWVTSQDGRLWKVTGGRTPTLGSVELDPGISDVATGAGAVWVANPADGTLTQVALDTSTIVRTIQLDGVPRSVTVDGETVWVAVAPGSPVATGDEVAGVQSLPGSFCEPVQAGGAEADVLIVSDLPLQGGIRLSAPQMVQAIAFRLQERGFRAGPYRIAYQSCDDSVGRTGLFDETKCEANARAYAGNPDVVGVVGPVNSPCAVAALPALNTAEGGAVAVVSPQNSFVGLTRAGPGVDPSLPAALYPTGRRNYARVYPTDDLQGAALALFARDRGRTRVFVLDDGEPGYGMLMATGFETAARRLGLKVVGRASWDPQAADYARLADRVAATGAEAVFLGGLLDTNAARVVSDLRARLGRSTDLLAPDGLTPLSLLVESVGPAARGVFVSLAGVVPERLPTEGSRFVERFERTQPGGEVEPSAVYAAQAVDVLLDAIARSDGSRASIVSELFRTRVEDGLLGSFGFDRNGDITESPVTILQVRRGGVSNVVQSVEGGVVARVVRPSPRLVAAGD